NPVWTALTTKQAQMAHSNALARRFAPEMTLLGALAANTAMAFDSLAQLIQRDAVTLYFTAPPNLPAGWEVLRAVELQQMVQEDKAAAEIVLAAAAGVGGSAEDAAAESMAVERASGQNTTTENAAVKNAGKERSVTEDAAERGPAATEVLELTAADVAEMSVVYTATRPGRTLCPRIQKIGTFLGVRDAGKLAAIGGLRLHIAGFREITSVATLPEFEGRGYATAIVRGLIERIRARGERPFLTVRSDNWRAIEIYRRLGFKERTRLYSRTVRRLAA
ncbi:MAG TPA: GNAT family N-acetyltransferase, partial [Candidatus Angelobacter sp.]|nr:GNAT family N-acetyltransferase [Candidatus Angelobacter sp.]